jgi:hypothetical protein
MSVRFEFSKSYQLKADRLKKLPEIAIKSAEFFTKKEAQALVSIFKTGIKSNKFNLEKLKDGTVRRKQNLGYKFPNTPLYGKGEREKAGSYINMLEVVKLKSGWVVRIKDRKHYSGAIMLRDLFEVHENGTIIKRGNVLIRIPPRPAFLKAQIKLLNILKSTTRSQAIKRTLNKYIEKGKEVHEWTVIEKLADAKV